MLYFFFLSLFSISNTENRIKLLFLLNSKSVCSRNEMSVYRLKLFFPAESKCVHSSALSNLSVCYLTFCVHLFILWKSTVLIFSFRMLYVWGNLLRCGVDTVWLEALGLLDRMRHVNLMKSKGNALKDEDNQRFQVEWFLASGSKWCVDAAYWSVLCCKERWCGYWGGGGLRGIYRRERVCEIAKERI